MTYCIQLTIDRKIALLFIYVMAISSHDIFRGVMSCIFGFAEVLICCLAFFMSTFLNSDNKHCLTVCSALACLHFARTQVNWTPKLPHDMLLEGRLPDVKLPLLVDDTKYCQFSFTDGKSNVEFGFHAKYVFFYQLSSYVGIVAEESHVNGLSTVAV